MGLGLEVGSEIRVGKNFPEKNDFGKFPKIFPRSTLGGSLLWFRFR